MRAATAIGASSQRGPVLAALLCLLLLPASLVAAAERFYPTLVDVETSLEAMETNYPALAKKHRIGTSAVDALGIHALQLSSNVGEHQDKPVWLFVGVIHGNEQLGLKVVMDLATRLTADHATDPDVRKWLDAYDIWLVPVMNPVGYQHRVRGNRPKTWVDLNRNYDFHWENGQSKPGASAYRGPAPFSEPETQAMRDLYRAIRPWFGMTFHHGNEPDGGQIMYPWNSEKGGFNPDRDALRGFAKRYGDAVFASRAQGSFCKVPKGGGVLLEDPEGESCGATQTSQFCRSLCWRPTVTSMGIVGMQSTWAYAAVGTLDLVVETNDRDFYLPFMREMRAPETEHEQATLAIAAEFSRNYLSGIESLFNNFLMATSSGFSYRSSGVTGHILDKDTQAPIHARIDIQGHSSAEIEPRFSSADSGRFWRFLPNGTHTITVTAPGYQARTQRFKLSSDVMRNLRILLEKQP